ncbi:hypothetical protein Cni_G15170 [Canna indica]|uniref:Protein POLAR LOCALIZATION DURING ASYMMETRIC DIVISION AND REDISTRIBUTION n=1 Tax=Canna indica TaxID=4628 RepID=A0AAQ3QEI3_9LILI|nr:hypothetical protein Cni_G15170 [Canna indica]
MACSRKQGSALCFCAALQEEGMTPSEAAAAAAAAGRMRIADCLEENREGEVEDAWGAKRRELFLCLPPAAAACDAYSPRSFISRLLLPLRRPSPARSGGGEGVGCRVLFPKCGYGSRKGRERRLAEEVEVDDDAVVMVMEGRRPAVDEGRSEVCASPGRCELAVNSGKKNDELPLNLGMGVGLVFLLARSATEINKMVELREEMEHLVKDIKDKFQKKDVSFNSVESSNNLCRHDKELETEAQSKCVVAPRARRSLEMDIMEAELQAELEHLQSATDGNQEKMELASESFDDHNEESGRQCGVSANELTRRLNQLVETRQQEGISELESSFNCNNDLEENSSEDNGEVTEVNEEASGNYYGVSAPVLERRLHELLEARQRERIAELESALLCAERKLCEKEREICWWRDTARLVSQHSKEALNR